MPVYIEKINGDDNRPTNQPTNRVNIEQSAFSKVRKIEKRQRFAIAHNVTYAIGRLKKLDFDSQF